jgi:hypothetical protein
VSKQEHQQAAECCRVERQAASLEALALVAAEHFALGHRSLALVKMGDQILLAGFYRCDQSGGDSTNRTGENLSVKQPELDAKSLRF